MDVGALAEPAFDAHADAPPRVVVIVASAGGLRALTRILEVLPADLPAAIVVQQHLSASGSALVPIIQRNTKLEVTWASEYGALRPGTVTICPPQSWLELVPDGTYLLRAMTAGTRFYPHDALLTSLAAAYASHGLAVVLTGMGHDGAAGTTALRAAGATVIAQSEASSEFSSMPMAAIAAGAEVMPLEQIAEAIVGLAASGT